MVVAETPMPKVSASMPELIRRFRDHHVERIAFERGVTQDELVTLMQKLSRLGGRPTVDAEKELSSAHVRIGRLKAEDRREDGIASDMAAIRQLYGNAVAAAEVAWNSAADGISPTCPSALHTVEGLADAVAQNRTALVALTAMRTYDNYTFTHMVNVSILTMGQARALGSTAGCSASSACPRSCTTSEKFGRRKEILNKPDKLTDEEFTIMRRHVGRRRGDPAADARDAGARARRRFRASPADRRHRLSLWRQTRHAQPGTMLCSIADVYDAMRSQRRISRRFRPIASSRC